MPFADHSSSPGALRPPVEPEGRRSSRALSLCFVLCAGIGLAVDAAAQTPTISIDDVAVREAPGPTPAASFTVSLSASAGQTVTVYYATANGTASVGSDYGAVSGTLTFSPGVTQRTISVAVNDDSVAENNETFFVNLSTPTNATIADPSGQGTIVDNDSANPVTPVSGSITNDTTWSVLASPYVVTGTVTVYSGTPAATATLTIAPQVEVRFNDNQGLVIGYLQNKGGLVATGVARRTILFTRNQKGHWNNIQFSPSTDPAKAILGRVIVEYGGSGGQGNISINGCTPTIRSSQIGLSSNYGVYVIQGGLTLDGSSLASNDGPYSMSLPADSTVTSAGGNTFDKPIELRAGTISGNTTWRNLGAPYVSSGTVYVFKDTTTASTLTIEPGVEVRFNQYQSLYVGYSTYKGTLTAQGTATAPILFTSNKAPKARGDWLGLLFQPGAGSGSSLQYATVEYGGYGGYSNVYISGSSPVIANSTLRESGSYGVYVGGAAASPSLQSTTIRDNNGIGLYVAQGTLGLQSVTVAGTGGAYSMSLPGDATLTTAGTHSFDKPIELRAAAVSGNTIWRNLGAPYVSSGTVYVFKDTTTASTLTIEPGVEVRFNQYQALRVGYSTYKGTLTAQGTATAPILFTSNKTPKARGDWYGLLFDPGAGSGSLVQQATVEYGGLSGYSNVYINGSSPMIANSTLWESGSYGVYVGGAAASLSLQSTTIRDNNGVGLYVAQGTLGMQSVTVAGTGGAYSMSLPGDATVTTAGTHSFDKPIELRAATVSGNTIWRNLGAPYVSSGTVYVFKDTTTASTLTIEPGVEVRFNQYQALRVGYSTYKGTLTAQGTATAPILFTSNKTPKARGDWYGLLFDPGAGSGSLVQQATVEYGGLSGYSNVYINGSSPMIANSTLRESATHGAFVTGAAAMPLLAANNFAANTGYGLNSNAPTPVAAQASWWNSASGPSEVGSGSGEKVTANVGYSPWLGAPQNPLFFASSGQIIDPVFDKDSGSTTLSVILSGQGNWTLQVLDQAGVAIKTFAGSGSLVTQAWSGEDESGSKVPNGIYTLRLTATDSTGAQTMAPLVGRVVVANDGPTAIISSPQANTVLRGGDVVPVFGTAADANNFVSYRVEYGAGAVPTYWYVITSPSDVTTPVVDARLATWNTASLTDSTYTLRLTARDATNPPATALVTVKLMTILNVLLNRQYFSPNGDGLADTTTLTATLTLPADWTLTFKDAGGAVVRTFSGSGTSINQVWDGNNASGAVVPEGTYTYTLEAVDPISGVAAISKTGTVTVDLSLPVAEITAPLTGATVWDTVLITGTAADSSNFESYKVEYGTGTSPTTWTQIALSYAQVANGTLTTWITNSFADAVLVAGGNGPYTLRLTVRDRAANVATAQVLIALDNMLISGVSRTSPVIRPTLGESSTIGFSLNQPAVVTLRMVPEASPLKDYPDQTPEGDAVRAISLSLPSGPASVTWDGKNNAGNIVPNEAYVYSIEARAPSGRFDKYNLASKTYPNPSEIYFPPSATAYDPHKNQFVFYDMNTLGAGRGSFRVEYRNHQNQTITLWPQDRVFFNLGPNSIFWDGRDAAGNIVTDIASINYYITGSPFVTPPQAHIYGIKTNYVIVDAATPRIPGISIKSDPYIVYLSFGQVTRLKYTLLDAARVTVTVRDPLTGAQTTLLSNQDQAAGDHEVVWDGAIGSGQLTANEGHYTFTVTATQPVSGVSAARRGNITVWK